MIGIEASMANLAVVIALMGIVPGGMALAADHGRNREAATRLAGVVDAVRREHVVLRAEDGRRVRVDAERCAAAAAVGERVVYLGHWDGDEFEPARLLRPGGEALRCRDGEDDDHDRLAAAAPIDAAAAIAAASQAGYGSVTDIAWQHGTWALRARDAAGAPVRLQVDGWTGQVVPQRR